MRDKDSQEIAAILQVMPETYSHSFGHELDRDLLKTYLHNLLAKRKLDFLDSTLNHMTPRSIIELLSQIDQSNNFEPVTNKIEPMESTIDFTQKAKKSDSDRKVSKSHLKKKV